MRTTTWAGVALAAGLVVAPMAGTATAAPASGWTTVKSYFSPTGDIAYGIQRKGDIFRFKLTAAAKYFDTAEFCVKKVHRKKWVCNERSMRPGEGDTYFAKIRWQGNYPTKGNAKRVVRFMKGSPKLTFRPS